MCVYNIIYEEEEVKRCDPFGMCEKTIHPRIGTI